MSSARSRMQLAPLPAAEPPVLPLTACRITTGTVSGVSSDGMIDVLCADGCGLSCSWLENGENLPVRLQAGDSVLLAMGPVGSLAVVMGRIGRHVQPEPPEHLKIEAARSITLVCGDSSVALRSDGKVMIRGDDVLVRAKGTQRIRAGTVSIN